MNPDLPPDERASLLLAHMTREEQVHLLCEHSHIAPSIARLGIPALRPADGPAGLRRSSLETDEGKATSLPAPIALAATWDRNAAQQYGDVIGLEAWATGHNIVFGPGLDIARLPVFGRLFEAFGEDPLLTGQMAVHVIQGIQRHAVMATAKHFSVNTQEEQRFEVDAQLDERTLQEIYTLPFALAIQEAQVGVIMGAYNKLNGIYCCEHPALLTTILRHQLGFTGWVTSDFRAVHSTIEAAQAGLDWELDHQATYFGDAFLRALQTEQISPAQLEEKVRRILRTMFVLGLFESPVQLSPFPIQEHGQKARLIAGQSIVLLKNAGPLLPLSGGELRSLAVIGTDADGYITGGGSSFVRPTYLVSILEGIRQRAGKQVQVTYLPGVDPLSAAALLPGFPLVPSSALRPSQMNEEEYGLHAEYWTNPDFAGEPAMIRTDLQVGLNLGFFNFSGLNASSLPPLPEAFNRTLSVRWTGNIRVPRTGNYALSLTHLGTARLFLEEQLLIEHPGLTLATQTVTKHLVAGQVYPLRIEYAADRPEQHASHASLLGAQISFGWKHSAYALPVAIQEAAVLAARSDVAIVVVRDYRCEHADLPNLTPPNEQDLLVQAVAAANPRTIVVLATGGPVALPWLDQVPAVLETWYGGQEVGNALASVLFGDTIPSGKLPVTFPLHEHTTPISSPKQYSRQAHTALFSEGLAVGYRGYDQLNIEPLFPFGFGLSYTSFAYSNLQVTPEMTDSSDLLTVSFTVANTGEWAGAEIAQVYLGLPEATGEPPKRLVGWERVELRPEESQAITIVLDPHSASHPLSYWKEDEHGWKRANGNYQVFVGASSRDIRLTGSFMLQ